MTQLRDLTGQKFGRLTVIERAPDYVQSNGRKRVQWYCICDCQKGLDNPKKILQTSDHLISGNTKSCGCIHEEYQRARNKNRYEKKDGYYIGYTNKNDAFYFDEEDYEKVKPYCWLKNDEGYIISANENYKTIWMHRVVLGLPSTSENPILVDHVHGKETRNDNRKCNLRLATHQENGHNVGLHKNNSTGVSGVSFDPRDNKYKAYLCINCNNMYLGGFQSFEEAVEKRKNAEEKYYKEYSYDNSQNMEYTKIQL